MNGQPFMWETEGLSLNAHRNRFCRGVCLWGIFLSKVKDYPCIYSGCQGCPCQCLRKAEWALKQFRIAFHSIDKIHSVTFKFTSPDECLMAYHALKWAGIRKAQIQFHI